MIKIEGIREEIAESLIDAEHGIVMKNVQYLLDKLQIAMHALEDIEEQCNSPHDVKIAEEALKAIRE